MFSIRKCKCSAQLGLGHRPSRKIKSILHFSSEVIFNCIADYAMRSTSLFQLTLEKNISPKIKY